MGRPFVATFSIVARDPRNGDLGIAVQSKFLAVGSVVPWAKAGVGAVATQALANVAYGQNGLALLEQGLDAASTMETLLQQDEGRNRRQLGIVDSAGRTAAWTGSDCYAWAGHVIGDGFTCQGNILTGPSVVDAMAEAFRSTTGELAERCVAALSAGQGAGGDRRGRQSAAIIVVRNRGSYGGWTDRYVDLRVDDHPDPIAELARLLHLHRFYLTRPNEGEFRAITPEIARELQDILRDLDFYDGPTTGEWDEMSRAALATYGGVENLEERLVHDDRIDQGTLKFLRAKRAARSAKR
ncbi:MAG: DUF1028 domain-containing protein [Herpetosiphon sp.]